MEKKVTKKVTREVIGAIKSVEVELLRYTIMAQSAVELGCKMHCKNPIRIVKNIDRSDYPDGLKVPCGRCLACRISKRREWTMRMRHELSDWDKSSFITLTYSDENLPKNNSLKKKHLQNFFKRLRRRLDKDGRKIRYFACGEYGEETNRAHYHAIIFGLSINGEDRCYVRDSWPFGHIHFGLAEKDSMQYVAQYVDKQYTGKLADKEYIQKGREPVFRILSLGIGKNWIDKNKDQVLRQCYITQDGVKMSVPRYYAERIELDTRELREKTKELEADLVKKYTGIDDLSFERAFDVCTNDELIEMKEGIKNSLKQHDKNLKAGINLKRSKKI